MQNNASPVMTNRKGAIIPLVALLLIPLLAMLAFSVDVGWITLTKADLQNAADAGAQAAARQLVTGYAAYNAPGQSRKATIRSDAEAAAATFAKRFTGLNAAGGVTSLVLKDSDIRFGFTDVSGNFTSPYNGYPNTVQVTARLDATSNGPLGLFFGPVLGVNSTPLTATAYATIYSGGYRGEPNPGGDPPDGSGSVNGFNSDAGINGMLLPVALDVQAWNRFLANGSSPDGSIQLGNDGSPQLQVYPSPGNAPGNFGLLSVGPPATSTPKYRAWIGNGPTPSDLEYLQGSALVPVAPNNPKPWAGGPGLKSTLRSDFAAIMGKPRLLPLFKPVSTSPYRAANGNGSNATYNIVGFVGVMISQASGSGSNMNISVQPMSVFDTTLVFDFNSIAPAGTINATDTTFVAPKLTR